MNSGEEGTSPNGSRIDEDLAAFKGRGVSAMECTYFEFLVKIYFSFKSKSIVVDAISRWAIASIECLQGFDLQEEKMPTELLDMPENVRGVRTRHHPISQTLDCFRCTNGKHLLNPSL